MQYITSTALAAGAQETCANSVEVSLPGMGSITRQPAFRPISRRTIMIAVNTCSRDLGLRQGSVVVLDALLSCLPCQGPDGSEVPITPATLLTVYASNETLCFRAKGLTDRQLRRHLATLEEAGLLLRRDSANGKRFPVMKAGKPVGAFGLDLSPLFARSGELLARALRRREQADELRGLRAQILRLRAACLELQLDDSLTAFLDGLRNLVRRTTLTLIEARAALARLTTVITNRLPPVTVETSQAIDSENTHPGSPDPDYASTMDGAPPSTSAHSTCIAQNDPDAVESANDPNLLTDETSASDGQRVRHTDTESNTKKRKPSRERLPQWSDLTEVSAFYPEPASERETAVIVFEFGKLLRISQDLLASAAARLGLWELLRIEDRIAGKVDSILSPDAYLRSILRA
ncbi:MAG: helix-turn-helix domain-containing protein [Paracoccaceae bacterium]